MRRSENHLLGVITDRDMLMRRDEGQDAKALATASPSR